MPPTFGRHWIGTQVVLLPAILIEDFWGFTNFYEANSKVVPTVIPPDLQIIDNTPPPT